ncbi:MULTISPECIES: S-methyl-5-thioribose-1-phosphate isomerase [Nitrospirillum]|uniref:Methylthioribose-1-phosphate isomerase n=1 Tax=Nitrospirillum amazonense TaxID=28077 RepID=A0A560FG48_9PROT|nr:S-methyl-5-thioribose-1-phosphate isomerase [Nitrospirillum amazonense]MEC4592729.1 S-methyl-5-thioribose-1-phosphate isomerase [Nitrospirillum amazonense]TWB20576.1 methylthioribose-1-phosphate isomerase [Nitrospirillum amazonense]
MKVAGEAMRTIWAEPDGRTVGIIDQTRLPFRFETVALSDAAAMATAITTMQVRGAPLIGAAAAYGMALAMKAGVEDGDVERAHARLMATRPTAVNLRWALDRMREVLLLTPPGDRLDRAYAEAAAIADEDVEICRAIGRHGLHLIRAAHQRNPDRPVRILTHCNAGWLATVDWGTATAPIYLAHEAGIPLHVWVDETRPRNQGAFLTAWELGQHGVPHAVIPDNTGGHLMQHGLVDLAIVGTDRTTAKGDVANKIGTYLKALAAKDNDVPFYVALPSSTIDWTLEDGVAGIPIEERSGDEVAHITGLAGHGDLETVRLVPEGSPVVNYAFDVTPARLITGLITERGVCSPQDLAQLFPDHQPPERMAQVAVNDE